MKTSINFQPVKANLSEAHNLRKVQLDYILPERVGHHEHWSTDRIRARQSHAETLHKEKTGRSVQRSTVMIREAVAVIKPDTSMADLQRLGDRLRSEFGIDCFQIHIHRDEGRVDPTEGIKVNHHAHLVFDWMNPETGRTFKLGKVDMAKIQTLTAEVLGMERGQENSKAQRLAAKEYKVFAQQLEQQKELLRKELAELEEKKKTLNAEQFRLSGSLLSWRSLREDMEAKHLTAGVKKTIARTALTKNWSRSVKSLAEKLLPLEERLESMKKQYLSLKQAQQNQLKPPRQKRGFRL